MKCWILIIIFMLYNKIISCDEFNILQIGEKTTVSSNNVPRSHYICTTDSINDAIIWNTDLNLKTTTNHRLSSREDSEKVPRLLHKERLILNERQCDSKDYRSSYECKFSFKEGAEDWKSTWNTEVPMGPVYDSRWERFEEYNTLDWVSLDYQPVSVRTSRGSSNLIFDTSGAIVVSIRGTNAHFLICTHPDYRKNSCYWIIIGGWENTRTVLRKCPNGISLLSTDLECEIPQTDWQHEPLSIHEWKTFVITWNGLTKSIELYDPDLSILSYSDGGSKHDNFSLYHVLFGNPEKHTPTLFRFHDYNYILTTKPGAQFNSYNYDMDTTSDGEICIDMTVGLCDSCELHVRLVDPADNKELAKNIISGFATSQKVEHGLPMWQQMRLVAQNIHDQREFTKLEITAKSTDEKGSKHWAIGDVQQCLAESAVKQLHMLSMQTRQNETHFVEPNVICQRLSYNLQHAQIIYSNMYLTSPAENVTSCKEHYIGPKCSVSCHTFTDGYCGGGVICNAHQCFCPQGYFGNNCSRECANGEYGYNCREKCDNCLDKKCSIYTGRCSRTICRRLQRKYQLIPPFCKDTVQFPELHFHQIDATTLRVYFHKIDHDKKFNITYKIELLDEAFLRTPVQEVESGNDNENRPIYFTTFTDLNPGTLCHVRIHSYIQYEHLERLEKIRLKGEYSHQMIMCSWTRNFTITSEERNLKIDKIDVEQFPCPDHFYSVTVIPVSSFETSQTIDDTSGNGKFPIIVGNLTPNTKYVISITGMRSPFYQHLEAWTLPTISFIVRGLKIDSVTSTGVSFSWLPPEESNDIIHSFSVKIKALRHEGCLDYISKDSINSQLYNITNISQSYTIHNLIPYVHYELTVLAHHASGEGMSSANFTTKATEIPTAVFKNLTFENHIIRWSTWVSDCTAVTGPINATRLFFFGVSENVKNFTDQYDSTSHSFTLNGTKKQNIHGCEQYRVRVHPLRAINGTHNESAYNELTFTTDPRAPDPPGIIYTTKVEKGIVDLNWEHPVENGGPVKEFLIHSELTSTKLVEVMRNSDRNRIAIYQVNNNQKLYKTRLNLLPSTHYKINVISVVICAEFTLVGNPSSVEIETPSSFAWYKDEPSYVVNSTNYSIILTLPPIDHGTLNTKIHVIITGEALCENIPKLSESLARDIGLKDGEKAWHTNSYSTSAPSIIIGNYEGNINTTNCSLVPGSSYVIVIVIREDDIEESKKAKPFVWRSKSIYISPVSKLRHEIWAVPLILLLIISLIAIYCYMKRSKNRKYRTKTMHDRIADRTIAKHSTWDPTSTECQESMHLGPAVSDHEEYLTPIDVHLYEEIECKTLVKLEAFQDYVKLAIVSGELDKQYSWMSPGQVQSWEDGLLAEHASGEEYDIAFSSDEMMVILENDPDDPYFECTNAHYMKGYKKDRAYIVLKGPQVTEIKIFWRMIWQERVEVICMLSDIEEQEQVQCDQYWPEVGEFMDFGNISVHNISQSRFADYTLRIFHVKRDAEIRVIDHLHYTAWPDYGIPLYTQSVVTFLKKLFAIPSSAGPLLIHCKSGVGRTGTIVLLDICQRRALADGVVDVFNETEKIRKQRGNMINNKQQYIFAHVALVECLLAPSTAIMCDDSMMIKIREHKNQLTMLQERTEQSVLRDKALQLSARSALKLSKKNIAKNRFTDALPMTRLYIPRYPISDDDSSYISGVYVDSARRRNSYIASQLPLPTTVTDFWRMIAAFKVELIIILQQPDCRDPTCCKFLPEPDEEIRTNSLFNIRGESITNGQYYCQQKIILVDESMESSPEQPITVLTCKEWDPGRARPPPTPATLVDLYQMAERISRRDEPTVVLCHDGVTGCGLYLALSFLLERMGLEHECDVCFAIRAVRRSRSNFCQTLDQFEYLYNAASFYVEHFGTYSNFK